MLLRRLPCPWLPVALGALLAAGAAAAQDPTRSTGERDIDIDFLFNYYDQDGENSAVTGGIGTEELQVLSPVILLGWKINDDWSLAAELGLDTITSASTDNIDDDVSSASRQDTRVFTTAELTRKLGQQQSVSFGVGFSSEYDYSSLSAGIRWSRSFRQNNTTLSAGLRHYADTVDLYGIDGVQRGDDDRDTTDLSLALTQVLSKKAVGTVELAHTEQSGFLSTPFHEVILADGERVAERLPDSRSRSAVGLSLQYAFSKNVVQRIYYRYYDDDWGIAAHTVEAETHFRLPTERQQWVFPILRFYSQSGSDFFGPPGSFTQDNPFFTADHDLSEFDGEKVGLGYRVAVGSSHKLFGGVQSIEIRLTYYTRDTGLDGFSTSYRFGWRF